MMRPCLVCGEPTEGTRCADCRPPELKAPTAARGYGARWQRLSRRARALQPFCTDCGTTNDLTVDHTPQAWARHQQGLPIRLADVAVVCRSCNARRGRARPQGGDPHPVRGDDPRGRPNLGLTWESFS